MVMDGLARALATVAPLRSGAPGAMSSGGQHGVSMARWGWGTSASQRDRATGRDRRWAGDGHGWPVGQTGGWGQAVQEVAEPLAQEVREAVRTELTGLVRQIIEAHRYEAAEEPLQTLLAHPHGEAVGKWLSALLGAILVHRIPYCEGLQRVSPEWCWRDFRLRLSHGRNHRSEERLERAALVWAIYHNFEPAQERSERQRQYRYPGQSALQVAGTPPGQASYLDALGV